MVRCPKIGFAGWLSILVALASLAWAVFVFTGPMFSPGRGSVSSRELAPAILSEDGRFWELKDGAVLRQFSKGEGQTQVVYLHGGPGGPNNQNLFNPKCSEKGGSCRINNFHQRGCGQSTRPFLGFNESLSMFTNLHDLEAKLGIGAILADLEQIRLALPNGKNHPNGAPLVLVGHSWGGLLAAMYAIEFPEAVEKLVLIAPADCLQIPRFDGRPDLMKMVRAALPADANLTEYDMVVAKMLDFNLWSLTEQELQDRWLLFSNYFRLATEGRYKIPAEEGMETIGGWMGTAQFLSLGMIHDYRSALAAIKCPVLLVHGAKDLMSVDSALEYQSYLTGSSGVELRVFEDAGHFVYLDEPERLDSTLDEFIERS